MLTKAVLKSTKGKAPIRLMGEKNGFHWRSHEITRIEGLSDAVFAFAVTLLIVSLEVPKSYEELVQNLRGFFAFAACFAQLMVVWYHQYLYYRRYNLQDFRSTVLSLTLLFVVLFYTYPLKFVFTSFLTPLAGGVGPTMTGFSDVRNVFLIYACGVIAVFSVFTLMYGHAYKRRAELGLTALECHDTLHTLREMIAYCVVALISATIALTVPDEWLAMAGLSYALTGIIMGIHGSWSGRKRSFLEKGEEEGRVAIP